MTPFATLHALVQSTQDDGLTARDILENLPSDPASIVALLLLSGAVAAVVWFGIRSGGKGGPPS
jgi:hypothetical protein